LAKTGMWAGKGAGPFRGTLAGPGLDLPLPFLERRRGSRDGTTIRLTRPWLKDSKGPAMDGFKLFRFEWGRDNFSGFIFPG